MKASLWINRRNCITVCQNILCQKKPDMLCTELFCAGRYQEYTDGNKNAARKNGASQDGKDDAGSVDFFSQ